MIDEQLSTKRSDKIENAQGKDQQNRLKKMLDKMTNLTLDRKRQDKLFMKKRLPLLPNVFNFF